MSFLEISSPASWEDVTHAQHACRSFAPWGTGLPIVPVAREQLPKPGVGRKWFAPQLKRFRHPEVAAAEIAPEVQRLFRERQSAPAFGPMALERSALLQLLSLALGLRQQAPYRTPPYPSAGGLYPLNAYLAYRAHASIPRFDLYAFDPCDHTLIELNRALSADIVVGQAQLQGATAVIYLSAGWGRSSAKYGRYAYRKYLIEAGHMAQNLLLLSSAMRFASRPYMGFDDLRVARGLGLDPTSEGVLYSVLLGQEAT